MKKIVSIISIFAIILSATQFVLADYLLKNGNILNRHPKVRPKSNSWDVGFFIKIFSNKDKI